MGNVSGLDSIWWGSIYGQYMDDPQVTMMVSLSLILAVTWNPCELFGATVLLDPA